MFGCRAFGTFVRNRRANPGVYHVLMSAVLLAVTVLSAQPAFAQKVSRVKISVTPSDLELEVASSAKLTAVDSSGQTLVAAWTSSNSAVATVSSSGWVTAVGAGTATITATFKRSKASAIANVKPPAPPAPVAGSPFLPFGPKQVPFSVLGQPPLFFTGGYITDSSPSDVEQGLQLARTMGARLILKLVGSRSKFQNPDGSFSLTLWKSELDKMKDFDFASYVADGTVIGIELINEPHDTHNWGGTIVSKEDLEAAAAYAKSYWPYMPVGAGRPDYVLQYAPWRYLDFAHAQYHMRKGDINAWRDMSVSQSKQAGVGLLLSLDFLAGEIGDTPMTADEVRQFYTVLADDTYACALTGYLYDAAYLSQPDIQTAFNVAGAIAASHPAPPCYVDHVK
jgi:hypothetical protein